MILTSGGFSPPESLADQLEQLSIAWEKWVDAASGPARKLTRLKMHLLFMLIRFGGLRLGEALAMDLARDIDCASGLVHIRGAYQRDVILPFSCLRQFARILGALADQASRLEIDSGLARRVFYSIAESLGIPKALAGPRALRYLRGCELLGLHMPLAQVQAFLGLRKTSQFAAFTRFLASLEGSPFARDSGPNVFTGVIEKIETGLRACLIQIRAFGGFDLFSRIQMPEFLKIEPMPGMTARVHVAPEQIALVPVVASPIAANALPCRIASLRCDPVECQARLELSCKSLLNAILETRPVLASGFDEGDQALACFPGRAVALEPL